MALNLNPWTLENFLACSSQHLTTAFVPCPRDAQRWLAAVLPRAQTSLVSGSRVHAWRRALCALPSLTVEAQALGATVGATGKCEPSAREVLHGALAALGPWRKGPFELFDVHIDAEWRSDWKWSRVAPHVATLAGRRVLDVGCGNGYYLWRMAQAGASLVLGLDPSLTAFSQFMALKRYLHAPQVFMLPLASADLDRELAAFDTVFSMGVLYHRRDPQTHLAELRRGLRTGGELVLETLIIAEGAEEVLIPAARYAAMGNVWAVPAPRTVVRWLQAAGFGAVRTVDITATTCDEQRRTAWMPHHSLADFLNPADPSLTIEGHPAPLRAVFVATAQ